MVEKMLQVRMSLADFIEQYHRQPFELIEGVVVPLSPNITGHQEMAQKLFLQFSVDVIPRLGGYVALETPFVLNDSPDWVKGSRTPDLAYYSNERWRAYVAATPDWREKPVVMVPDLVVEIVSPTDRYSEVQDKMDSYLADGVKVDWLMDRKRKKVVIYRADSDQQTTLSARATLGDDDLLPGLSIAVSSLFV